MDRPFYGVGQGDKKIRKSGSTGCENPVWNFWNSLLVTIFDRFWWNFDILFYLLRGWKVISSFFPYRFMQNRKIRFSAPESATTNFHQHISYHKQKVLFEYFSQSDFPPRNFPLWLLCVQRETEFSSQTCQPKDRKFHSVSLLNVFISEQWLA